MFTITIECGQQRRQLVCDGPLLLSEAARRAGASPALPCGGNHTCGKCRAAAHGALEPPGEEEARLLALPPGGIPAGERLLCLCRAVGDCTVTLPVSAGDHVEQAGALPEAVYDPPRTGYGLAADIGTTTVALDLYALSTRRRVGWAGALNLQRAYGADVISRIAHTTENGTHAMQACITSQLRALAEQCLTQAGVEPEQVHGAVVTGNTTMLHFLRGLDARGIAAAPFTPQSLFGEARPLGELLPGCAEDAALYLPHCVGAYVGADIVCAAVAVSLRRKNALLVDIGTNGEMMLCADGALTCCATAAGPAFEGADISMGMTAGRGAIDCVERRGDSLEVHTVSDAPARGICGTGLISTLCRMLECGALDETGRIVRAGHPLAHLVRDVDGQPALLLGDSGVHVTQGDVRSLQLAKAAIAAGIDTLLHETGTRPQALEALYLCGGFGSRLDCAQAAAIGLIPQALAGKAVTAGNAAATGAGALLLSGALREEGARIATAAREIPLSSSAYFMDSYVEHMLFEIE